MPTTDGLVPVRSSGPWIRPPEPAAGSAVERVALPENGADPAILLADALLIEQRFMLPGIKVPACGLDLAQPLSFQGGPELSLDQQDTLDPVLLLLLWRDSSEC